MTKGELERAIRRAHNNFDTWNECTGIFTPGTGYYSEALAVIEDAVHMGAQAATGDYHQLEGEEPCPAYCHRRAAQPVERGKGEQ